MNINSSFNYQVHIDYVRSPEGKIFSARYHELHQKVVKKWLYCEKYFLQFFELLKETRNSKYKSLTHFTISCLFQVQNKNLRFRKIQQSHASARRTAFFRGSLKANPSGPTHILIFIGLHERGQTFQMIGLYYHACVIIEYVNYS